MVLAKTQKVYVNQWPHPCPYPKGIRSRVSRRGRRALPPTVEELWPCCLRISTTPPPASLPYSSAAALPSPSTMILRRSKAISDERYVHVYVCKRWIMYPFFLADFRGPFNQGHKMDCIFLISHLSSHTILDARYGSSLPLSLAQFHWLFLIA
jgi:hypothetical protein